MLGYIESHDGTNDRINGSFAWINPVVQWSLKCHAEKDQYRFLRAKEHRLWRAKAQESQQTGKPTQLKLRIFCLACAFISAALSRYIFLLVSRNDRFLGLDTQPKITGPVGLKGITPVSGFVLLKWTKISLHIFQVLANNCSIYIKREDLN